MVAPGYPTTNRAVAVRAFAPIALDAVAAEATWDLAHVSDDWRACSFDYLGVNGHCGEQCHRGVVEHIQCA